MATKRLKRSEEQKVKETNRLRKAKKRKEMSEEPKEK